MASASGMSSAIDRFFAIHELVVLFLHQADRPVLTNCSGVCRLWRQIVEDSQILQENLFLRSMVDYGDTSIVEGAQELRLNPILKSHFAALLAYEENPELFPPWSPCPLQSKTCTYADLVTLPWARDGTEADGPPHQAFARKEASWHRMLVSQPPILRLDWSHSWESVERRSEKHRFLQGGGHEDFDGSITLGMLWDWIEPRLLRQCSVQTTIFVAGTSISDDPSAKRFERFWERIRLPHMGGKFSPNRPRTRVLSFQEWPDFGPSWYQEFDFAQLTWRVQDELPWGRERGTNDDKWYWICQNGCSWLHLDCQRDHDAEIAEKTWRWSKKRCRWRQATAKL